MNKTRSLIHELKQALHTEYNCSLIHEPKPSALRMNITRSLIHGPKEARYA